MAAQYDSSAWQHSKAAQHGRTAWQHSKAAQQGSTAWQHSMAAHHVAAQQVAVNGETMWHPSNERVATTVADRALLHVDSGAQHVSQLAIGLRKGGHKGSLDLTTLFSLGTSIHFAHPLLTVYIPHYHTTSMSSLHIHLPHYFYLQPAYPSTTLRYLLVGAHLRS